MVIVNWTNGLGQRPYQLYLHSQGAGCARGRSIGSMGFTRRAGALDGAGASRLWPNVFERRKFKRDSTTLWDSHRRVPEGFQMFSIRRCFVNTIWTERAGSLKGREHFPIAGEVTQWFRSAPVVDETGLQMRDGCCFDFLLCATNHLILVGFSIIHPLGVPPF